MTFAAPLFLVAILTGLVPVILHLIHQQRAPVLPFSTLRFLKLSVRQTRRRKLIHDLMLLLLRVAAFTLIALALARPTIRSISGWLGSQGPAAVVIVLDNSASMATSDQSGLRWQVAIQAAEQLLDQLRDGDQGGLLVASGPPLLETNRLYENHEVLREALDVCRPSFELADLAVQLQHAHRLLDQLALPNKEIYIITDMQTASWSNLAAAPPATDAAPPVAVVVVDVHGAPMPNVGLRQLQLELAAPVAGVPARLDVELQGDPAVAQQRHLELRLNGIVQDVSPTLELEAGGSRKYAFSLTFPEAGLFRGEVQLVGQDACPNDDRLFFAAQVDPRIPVAIVTANAAANSNSATEDAFYLQRALLPVTEDSWSLEVTRLISDRLTVEPLDRYRAVFCVNLPAPSPAAASRLLGYVRQGGHLFWTCGNHVETAAYNALNVFAQGELLPLPLTGIRDATLEQPEGAHLGWLDEQHPALAPLATPPSLYQSVLVYRHVELAEESAGTLVLARLEDGRPLLVGRELGLGSVHLLATAVHVDWSNLPLRPLFMPLMTRLTFHLAGAAASQPQRIAGSPLIVSCDEDDGQPEAEVVRPNGDTVHLEPSAESHELRYADTHDIGVYQVNLHRSSDRSATQAFAVNITPAELDGSTLSESQLRERLNERHLVYCSHPADVSDTVRDLREGYSLRELVLLAVLAVLVTETFVANRHKPQPG